ncbi:hypothetical protein ACSZME_01260 [Aeromonas dhakensis]|uniref:hypothetical protein n=1 Tax=Aeromonas TaxID=642 RepID=UPI00344A15F6
MNIDFFKNALKYNASLSIVSVFILLLTKPLFEKIEFISNNPIISLLIFLASVNAVIITVIYTVNKDRKTSKDNQQGFNNNRVTGNKAKNITITTEGDMSGNTISNNEANGDLNIGQGFKNGK